MFDIASSPARRRRLSISILASIVTHAVVFATIAAVFFNVSIRVPENDPPPTEQIDVPTLVFIPAVDDRTKTTETPSSDPIENAPSPAPVEMVSDDSEGLEIAFAGDGSGQQLLALIRDVRAAVGFANPEQAIRCGTRQPQVPADCFYEHRLTAPDWIHQVGRFSIAGYFLLRLEGLPTELQQLRSLNGIPGDYVAYALLPEGMLLDVEDAIVEELKVNGQADVMRATSVQLTFAAGSPRGFHLRIIATKPVNMRKFPR